MHQLHDLLERTGRRCTLEAAANALKRAPKLYNRHVADGVPEWTYDDIPDEELREKVRDLARVYGY